MKHRVENGGEPADLVVGGDSRLRVEVALFHAAHRPFQLANRTDQRTPDVESHADAEDEAHAGDAELDRRDRKTEEFLSALPVRVPPGFLALRLALLR